MLCRIFWSQVEYKIVCFISVADGGLGIPELQYRIPGYILFRLEKLHHSNDPIISSLSTTDEIQSTRSKCLSILNLEEIPTEAQLRKQLDKNTCQQLYSTVDGKGLQEARKFPTANNWTRGATRLMHGNSFVHSIKLWINQLPTREQTTHGGRPGERKCRGCSNYVETLSHILQKCPRTHGPHIQRHDSIARLIAERCQERGWQVTWAPRICTTTGIKKPDLIIHNQYKIAVVDVTITWDSPEPLSNSYQDKLDNYDTEPVCAIVKES